MTSSSTLRLTIIAAVSTLIAGVMYATILGDDADPARAEAGSSDALIGETPNSDPYQGDEENGHDHVVANVADLRREVAFLRKDLASVHRRLEQFIRRADEVEQQDPARSSAVSAGMETPKDLAAERQRIETESEQRILAQAEANEAALQKEPEDTAWSGEARDVITSAVAAEEFAATSVDDVECRATLCRVEVTHKDQQARGVFEQQFILAVAQLLPQVMMQTVESENGTTSTILYLARDGHDFPQPEL